MFFHSVNIVCLKKEGSFFLSDIQLLKCSLAMRKTNNGTLSWLIVVTCSFSSSVDSYSSAKNAGEKLSSENPVSQHGHIEINKFFFSLLFFFLLNGGH